MGLVQTTATRSSHKHFESTRVQEPLVSSWNFARAPEGSAYLHFSDGGASVAGARRRHLSDLHLQPDFGDRLYGCHPEAQAVWMIIT